MWAAASSDATPSSDPSPSSDDVGVSGGGGGGRDPWQSPRRGEDQLLHRLWQRRRHEGWWLAEVPVGGSSAKDARPRRFDAIVVPWPTPRQSAAGADLGELKNVVAAGCEVELIEAKRDLNADAIGQLLSGAHLFSGSWPGHGALGHTLCVENLNDYALQWYCAGSGIRIEHVKAPLT